MDFFTTKETRALFEDPHAHFDYAPRRLQSGVLLNTAAL